MPIHDVIQVDVESFDTILKVEFALGQEDYTLLEATKILIDVLRQGRLGNRFEELIALNVTLTSCEIRLRYYNDEKRTQLGITDCGYDDVLGVWFLRYLFANVDKIRKIATHPLHVPDLSIFLQDPAPFDEDPFPPNSI